jgi:hypothetical protein
VKPFTLSLAHSGVTTSLIFVSCVLSSASPDVHLRDVDGQAGLADDVVDVGRHRARRNLAHIVALATNPVDGRASALDGIDQFDDVAFSLAYSMVL